MPRDANGVYSLPPVYLAVTGSTITALQHNSPMEDLASAITASLPRNGAAPMQGTLRINNADPTINLQDTDGRSGFLNVNGGIFSVQRGAANGTIWDAGPNGRAPFTVNLENGNATFSGAWTSYGASVSNGNIEIKSSWPALSLQKSAANESNMVLGRAIDGKLRWVVTIGNSAAEGVDDSGADFSIDRYGGADVWLGSALSISRSTGVATLSARPSWAGLTPWDSGNFNPNTKVAKTGDTMTGALTIQNTSPSIVLADTDNATRYLQNNGGLVGFRGSDTNWKLNVNDAGAVSTGQFGDLSTRIEDRAAAHAATRVAKTGDTMTGALTIQNTSPSIVLADTDNATRYLQNNGGTIGFLGSDVNWKLRTDDAGAVWTQQFGDLSTRIEDRAAAYATAAASARVAKIGDTMTGALTIQNAFPTLVLADTDNATRYLQNDGGTIGFLGSDVNWKLRVDDAGAVWTAQLGDLSSRIENRADSWSATRREEAKSWAYANLVGNIRYAGGGDVSAAVNVWAGTGWGDTITGIHWSSVNSQIVDVVRVKSLQIQINGSWYTIVTS